MDTKKRKTAGGTGSSNGTTRSPKRSRAGTVVEEYSGFSLQNNTIASIPTIATPTSSAKDFFNSYVSKRRPCIIDSLPKLPNGKDPIVTPEILIESAGNKMVQVERRLLGTESFGQNRTHDRQCLMTVKDFVSKLGSDQGDMLYLSTQEGDDGPFQAPCRELLNQSRVSNGLEWAGNLILHACNLWMGKSNASSGLHHDFHDNFYLLLKGRKRFRLYSPDCAPFLSTYGEISKIHCNGRISYKGHECRADGVPIEQDNNLDDEQGKASDNDSEEDEVILGKGFDYKSDSDSSACFQGSDVDDYDELVGNDNEGSAAALPNNDGDCPQLKRPGNFSRIDPNRSDRSSLLTEFPLFDRCKECVVELYAGQSLFVPAGWFHEVTSFGESTECTNSNDEQYPGYHVALNYWYHPPDTLDNFDDPYKDDFWRQHENHKNENVEGSPVE